MLTRVQDQVFRVYRIHDLLLDYARTAFGTGRARVASVPNVLPREMRDMHGELLDRLIADSPTGAWADIDEALHFGTYLGWHMVMAGQPELLHILIMEADATGAPAWLMRARRHGQTSDFLGDLAKAIGVASADIAHARTDAERAESTARAAACCAVFTTIAAKASAIPVGLLPRMVGLHRISSSEALASANLVAGGLGCWMLAELLPLIPAGVRRETWSSLFAKALYGYEFAMIGERFALSRD